MFQAIRELSDTVAGLGQVGTDLCGLLTSLVELSSDTGNLQARVDELERAREGWEAHTEAELVRSGSQFKAARSAEERARTMTRHAEALQGDENGESDAALQHIRELLESDAPAGAAEEVQAVHANVALSPKALARLAKFGVNSG